MSSNGAPLGATGPPPDPFADSLLDPFADPHDAASCSQPVPPPPPPPPATMRSMPKSGGLRNRSRSRSRSRSPPKNPFSILALSGGKASSSASRARYSSVPLGSATADAAAPALIPMLALPSGPSSPPARRHTDPFSAFGDGSDDDDETREGHGRGPKNEESSTDLLLADDAMPHVHKHSTSRPPHKHKHTSHDSNAHHRPHRPSPLAFPHHLALESSPALSGVSIADDESGMMSPLTAAHAAATLTELAFLQSLLDPSLTRHDMHLLIGTRVQRLIRDDDAGRMGKMTPVALAGRRVPAIVLTVVLEMGVGAVVGTFSDLLERHVVLVNFMPMISSICGNIGLQASTSTLRALATGHATHASWKSVRGVLVRELSAGLAIGTMLLLGLTLMVTIWVGDFRTGFVCGLSIMLSASAAGIMGSLAPVFFKVIGFDPALCAGPLETAVQDLVGISIYLTIGRLLLP